ncbi:MAG TPA: hypothetical protein PLY87_16470 [Planctomycetaceae bacterium]|nr:hypothetical protein [Planctomycetaceae bacterium]
MTDLLDDFTAFRVQPQVDVVYEADVDGKGMYRDTSRLVSRETFLPNMSRQVMSASHGYEGFDPFRALPYLRRVGDHPDVRIATIAAQMFALAVADHMDIAVFTQEVQRIVSEDVLSKLVLTMGVTLNVGRHARSFVDDAQRLASQGKVDAALDLIYDRADEMLLAGEFVALDSIIEGLDVEQLSVDVLLAVLTITLPAKDKLTTRNEFFECVKRTLKDRGEYMEGLLTGLQ